MKGKKWFCKLILISFGIGLFSMFNSACKKSSDNTSQESVTVPVLTTSNVTNINSTSATCGGNITSIGGGTITARGVCWSTTQNPTVVNSKTSDGSGTGSFTSNLLGLSPATPYYVRAYATNSVDTGYGAQATFITLPAIPGTVTDYDGNVYHTVTIETQVWLAENMKVTHYRNGDPINTAKSMRNLKFPSTAGQYWDYNQ
jgi:hypothetical protein